MRAIILMFDSLNRHMLPPYADSLVRAPNFIRLAERSVAFETFYAGSMPCMPARREMHTGRYNFLHRGWGPLEPFDESMPERLKLAGVHTHLASDHPHYWEDGGATYHARFSTWEFFRGQEGDPWKGVVESQVSGQNEWVRMARQDLINRSYMPSEADHSQTLTVDAGLHFLTTNAQSDQWMLQLELFDPHEPFFTHEKYQEIYGVERGHPRLDWPGYEKQSESVDLVESARKQYAALVSMCDHSLGRVLDAMDQHQLWDDTLLIVNTDHGYLLGEHGWWAKSIQPWYNELVHIPMFVWDPRSRAAGTRRSDLSRTIDIAPTVLAYFGLEPSPDAEGRDLCSVDAPEPSAALFGMFGGHVNVTDGRYVYMRASHSESNSPMEEFTLMPTRMRRRFGVEELQEWEPAEPFAFTKGLRTMRVPTRNPQFNSWLHGTLLFDTLVDPHQLNPLEDDEIELRMLGVLRDLMLKNDAPASLYERLGIPETAELATEHLAVKRDAARAARIAKPIPDLSGHPARELLDAPIAELLMSEGIRAAFDQELPWLTDTEMIAAPPTLSLLGLARSAALSADDLVHIADALARVQKPTGDATR